MTSVRNRLRSISLAALMLSAPLASIPLVSIPLASFPLAAAAAGQPGEAAASSTGSYLAGRYAQHQDDWTAAARYTAEALAADPDDPALLRRSFLLRLGEGQIDTALGYAGRLLGDQGEPQMALTLLAADALAKDKLDEADGYAAKMPSDGLGRFVTPLTRAWLAAARGKTDDALAALEPLASVQGFGALHALHAGLILDLAGRSDEAAARYAKVTDTDAPLRVVQIVGNFMDRTGRKEEARQLYRTFQAGNPDGLLVEPALDAMAQLPADARPVPDARSGLAEALFDLGSALHHENADEPALLFARVALHLRNDLPLAHLLIADIMASRDHHDEALAEYRGLEKDPLLGWTARMREADSLARMDRTDDAVAVLKSLSADRPERTDAAIRLGDVYRYAKRYDEAIGAYTTALQRIGAPEERHWPLLYARAMSYEKTGQWEKAEADLQAALVLKPDEASLLNFLGYSWIDRGQHLDKAKAMVERAAELRPRDGYIVDSLGWALYMLGDYDGAVTRLERAVELKPADPTINDHLGDAYWRAGRRNEARFQWTRALRSADEDTDKAAIQAKLDKGLPELKAAAKQ
ncbi:tetratricopeptide repeat protein [Azospirillum picis]|uniref:Tetratricopeptide (TPR) repeat protein n=1 Tax=Azospirillum picis TaxID=488438 RepID=A0ABU0MVJ5_9PROT|nr:tetratricopeptide repeat protein [Azospirillum picis]MBP2303285.1 tetratricopeptide (TPR) repeat protein [Azospirillum picis]MDQ0537091.1 tetratricopeptide (TPR) repeat protein [Azospirillum picis]